MPKPKSIIRKTGWHIRLPDDLMALVAAELYSEVESCIPYGAMSNFIEQCIREHFSRYTEKPSHDKS